MSGSVSDQLSQRPPRLSSNTAKIEPLYQADILEGTILMQLPWYM